MGRRRQNFPANDGKGPAVSEHLGHADPGFTLRVYTHLMPDSDVRSKKAIDDALRSAQETVDGLLGVPDVSQESR